MSPKIARSVQLTVCYVVTQPASVHLIFPESLTIAKFQGDVLLPD